MKELSLILITFITFCACQRSPEPINPLPDPIEPKKTNWKDTLAMNCFVDTLSSIDSLWNLWKQHEPDHYLYRVKQLCFCEPIKDYQIEITNSEIDTVYLIDFNEDWYGTPDYESLVASAGNFLIDSLFSMQKKEDAYDPDYKIKSFHDSLFFPCHFVYDFRFDVFDEEYEIEISLFVIAEN